MYAKVFSQIYDGTLCTKGPWQALVTFQQLLVLADQEGVVDMTAEAISRRTTIPLEIIELGLRELLKPDRKSRSPTEKGKRIIPLSKGREWGWLIVNYKHYRGLKREEDRRKYHREYWHKRKGSKLNGTQQAQPNQPIAEAYAEVEKPLRSAPKSVDNSTLAAAWMDLRKHISNNTRPEDALLREAALQLGGIDRLGAMSTWDLDKRRQDFESAYKIAAS